MSRKPKPTYVEDEPLFNVDKCDCGGEVRGVFDFGRWFSWCEKCSPVVRVPGGAVGQQPSCDK